MDAMAANAGSLVPPPLTSKGMAANADTPIPPSRNLKITALKDILTASGAGCGQISAVCAIVFVIALLAAIVGFGVYISEQRTHGEVTGTPFCCPEEAEEMYRYLNDSVDPCKDFFAYVCTNRTRGSSEFSMRWWNKVVVTGVPPEGTQMRNAGLFLNAYHKSCLETLSHHEQFFTDLAVSIAETMRQLLLTPNTRNAMAYCITMSHQYKLSSVIEAAFYESSAVLNFPALLWCSSNPLSELALKSAALALRNTLNMSATEEGAIQIRQRLCTRYPSGNIQFNDIQSFQDIFFNDVWSFNELKDGFQIFGYQVTNTTPLQTIGLSGIRAIHDIFSAPPNETVDALKAVILLWKSVESGQIQFNIKPGMTSSLVFQSCEKSLAHIEGLRYLLIVELLIHPSIEVKATAIFTAIRGAVYEHCRSSTLFAPEDRPRLETFLRGISLLTPSESGKAPVEVPVPTGRFASDLLRGRAYTFAVSQKRIADLGTSITSYKPAVYFRSPQLLYLPPELYTRSVTGTSFRSELVSMTVLGRLMAESLWYLVLSNDTWGSKTVANLERLLDCFVSNYTTQDQEKKIGIRINQRRHLRRAAAADALGLASIPRALSGPEWRTSKPAWSLWHLSHGQLFYILTTFYRCPDVGSPSAVRPTNAPLRQLDDFAKTFHCSPRAPMAPKNRCTRSFAHKQDE
ncbi:hypothetical protein HPB48_007832 [Haemaphysalis longicornis]|uniref:Peptidase M13 N-terminal domain-containing protein n=1 Tax=Haemaphysalis longicornis TaxID=44386 RepID=A0A9J6G2H3_HAELO|nr:hypothetical protein HPB48_007832 [Haemaphysalis longicornis]